jgi:uncharacterized ion transporter superfamily protein YfcC
MTLRVPHTYVLLMAMALVAAAGTWVIPSGRYDRIELHGRQVISPETYHEVERNPAGIGDVLLAFPRGLAEVADIVFYIFIIGGAFGVVDATGTIRAGIGRLVQLLGTRQALVVPVLTLVFAFGGGTIGIAEETLIFLPPLFLLCRSMGYDSLTVGGIALVGANAGFAGAFMNPFTVGVAQGIVGLPLFSGMGFRVVLWMVMTGITMVFVSRYAAKVRANPRRSPMYELDQRRQMPELGGGLEALSGRHVAVLVVMAVGLGVLAVGALQLGWGIRELSALFVGLAIATGLAGGLSTDDTAASFVNGAASLTYAALVVGLARGILVILSDAAVVDTIMRATVTAVERWPASVSVLGIYLTQNGMNVLLPSGSGQAALSMPILAPVGDLLGITRQTIVLAYQLGDGITNAVTPTQGYLMAGLGILQIPWAIWARWLLPLLALWLTAGAGAVMLAHAIRLGPF